MMSPPINYRRKISNWTENGNKSAKMIYNRQKILNSKGINYAIDARLPTKKIHYQLQNNFLNDRLKIHKNSKHFSKERSS